MVKKVATTDRAGNPLLAANSQFFKRTGKIVRAFTVRKILYEEIGMKPA
ncbi:MAG: hypothetical protein ACLPYZ_10880 [Limisphaerales bacterium]